jgi:Domain of unknown function (DUF4440)
LQTPIDGEGAAKAQLGSFQSRLLKSRTIALHFYTLTSWISESREQRLSARKHNMVKTFVFGVILAVAVPWGGVKAENLKQLSKAEAGLVAADSARYAAMINRDVKALDLLLADELVYIHSSSTRQSKSEHLHDIEKGGASYKRIETKEQVPSIYGNAGLIQGIASFTTGAAGRAENTFTLRYTSVYVRRQGRWQMVAFSCSRITEAGATGPRAGGPSAGGAPGVAPPGPPPGSSPQT